MLKANEVDPANVHQDRIGHMTRRWFVRLPVEMIADDTKSPKIWRAVQQHRQKMMKRHDQVYAVAYDESFAVEAIVTDATADAVVLGGMKIIGFPERTTPLFSDGTYRVAWVGTGYAVLRFSDGRQMGPVHASEGLAIRHLKQLYPTPVG